MESRENHERVNATRWAVVKPNTVYWVAKESTHDYGGMGTGRVTAKRSQSGARKPSLSQKRSRVKKRRMGTILRKK